MTEHPASAREAPPPQAHAPLEGVRAIVLTQAWAGAYCTSLLAMMGADVIQVEVRKRPDSWRGAYDAPIAAAIRDDEREQHPWNVSPLYNSVNLGKRCITLDLQTPEGLDVFKRLVPLADVIAENFSPRVLGNLGIPYPVLREIRPDVILCSLSAYGGSGPWTNVPGIGGTIEPTSGMSGLLGYEGGQPLNSGQMYPDAVAALSGFAAILTALHHRHRTGEGQHIDLSMQEANLSFLGDAVLEYTTTGNVRQRMGNRHLTFAPHGIYPAAGRARRDDHWVALACESEAQWSRLCEVAGRPDWLADPRFAGNAARKANEDALDEAIAGWTAEHERDTLARRLSEAGVIAAPVLDPLEVAADPVLRERGHIVEVDHPEAGVRPQAGVPFRLGHTPGAVRRYAPRQGEHGLEVLSELLGMTAEEYESLVERGISGEGPPPGVLSEQSA